MKWDIIVKTLREKMLVTQMEFSEILKVSFASINRWERGKYEPTMKQKRQILELCKKYNIETER